MSANKLFLPPVLLLLAILACLFFLGGGALGSDQLWGIGKTIGIIEIIIIVFLALNLSQFARPSLTTVVVLLWLPWVILTVFCSIKDDITIWLTTDLLPVCFWPLIYLFFYAYTKCHPESLRVLVIYFQVLSVICSALFFLTFRTFNALDSGRMVQLVVVNFPLLTFPWLVLVKRPSWRYFGMGLIALAVFCSLKRASLAALVLTAATYFVVEYFFLVRRYRFIWMGVPVVLLCLAVLSYNRVNSLLGGAFSTRIDAMGADQGSGRLKLYADVLDELKASSAQSLVLGHGHCNSIEHFGATSHNDFLEAVFDYGIVGLVLYVLLHLCLMWRAYKLFRSKSPYAAVAAAAYVLFFSLSMVSHLVIYPTYFVYVTALWGTVEALTQVKLSQPERCRRQRGVSPDATSKKFLPLQKSPPLRWRGSQ